MLNNEQVGISAEVAIANVFGVEVNAAYRARSVAEIVSSIEPIVRAAFDDYGVPAPIQHVAEGQNAVDFILEDDKTLSVKTNKQKLGKAAPQKVGQASSHTWFSYLASDLGIAQVPSTYEEKVRLFKAVVLEKIDKLLAIYWDYMFSCSYLLHFYNVVDANDRPTNSPEYIVFDRQNGPTWDINKITFTKPEVAAWNESNTVKYDGVAIGEFQMHNNRDNFKFRFNVQGIVKLISENKLRFS